MILVNNVTRIRENQIDPQTEGEETKSEESIFIDRIKLMEKRVKERRINKNSIDNHDRDQQYRRMSLDVARDGRENRMVCIVIQIGIDCIVLPWMITGRPIDLFLCNLEPQRDDRSSTSIVVFIWKLTVRINCFP